MNALPLLPQHHQPIVASGFQPCGAADGALVPGATDLSAEGLAAGCSSDVEERPRFAIEYWCQATETARRHRIVLADDHPVVRQSLKRLLNQQEDFHLVGESDNGLKTLALVKQFHPDLLVTDLMMPGMNGLEVTRRTRLSFPATRVVVVSVNADEPYVAGAFRCGASAFVLKTTCGQHLVPAMRSALAGQRYVSPPLSGSSV